MTQTPHNSVSKESQDAERYEDFLQRFTRDRERLFAFVCSLVVNRADAEDVFQQCSLVLWRKFASFRPQESFLTWACGVAHFEVKNYLRTHSRDRLQFDNELVDQLAARRVDSLAQRDERIGALRSCLQSLSADQQTLLEVAYGTGKIKDWATVSGTALQTAYNRLSRLRRQLLECVRRKISPPTEHRG